MRDHEPPTVHCDLIGSGRFRQTNMPVDKIRRRGRQRKELLPQAHAYVIRIPIRRAVDESMDARCIRVSAVGVRSPRSCERPGAHCLFSDLSPRRNVSAVVEWELANLRGHWKPLIAHLDRSQTHWDNSLVKNVIRPAETQTGCSSAVPMPDCARRSSAGPSSRPRASEIDPVAYLKATTPVNDDCELASASIGTRHV